jgi:hypothetical protein
LCGWDGGEGGADGGSDFSRAGRDHPPREPQHSIAGTNEVGISPPIVLNTTWVLSMECETVTLDNHLGAGNEKVDPIPKDLNLKPHGWQSMGDAEFSETRLEH